MRPTKDETTQFNLRLDPADKALVEAAAAQERISISEVLRRGLRMFAQSVGVETPKRLKKEKRLL